MKRLLAMTALLVVATAGFAAWVAWSDSTLRVTLTNRTPETLDDLDLYFDEEPRRQLRLAPGESITLRRRPPAAEGSEVRLFFGKTAISLGKTSRWATFEFVEQPPDADGRVRRVLIRHYSPFRGVPNLMRMLRGGNPLDFDSDMTYETSR